MTLTIEEFEGHYDEWADEYDEENDNEHIHASESMVVEYAAPKPEDTVVDLGAGTGAIALELAGKAGTVIGRDISENMLARAREKAAERGIENVEFGWGRFRAPNVERADIVVSNFALHHLGDEEKREAIEVMAGLNPRRIVLGQCLLFGKTEPDEPVYNQDTIYPCTLDYLRAALNDVGFELTLAKEIHEQVGVVVAERDGFN